MKHTVLLAAATQANLLPLLDKSETLLHNSYKKIFKTFYLDQLLNLEPQVVGASRENGIDQLINKVEHELRVEKYAKDNNFEFKILRDLEDDSTLMSESTVADLMIVEIIGFQHDIMESQLNDLLKKVKCPVLLLPHNFNIECFVAVHDGSRSSVKMMKRFVELFGISFRDLPFSVLMSDPGDKLDMKNEKVFIDFLKRHFKNLGAQHMYDDVLPSLFTYVQNECVEPMILINDKVAKELVNFTRQFDNSVLNHPIFIFKD